MALIAPDPSCKQSGLSTVGKECAEKKTKALQNSSMQPQDAEFNTEGLPKAFLHSLRTLFDILDDGKRGYVHISEIESRWQGAEEQDLPGGVLQSLRRVTPPHGCLTFERFVAGLRSSILNPDKAHPSNQTQKQHPLANGYKVRPLGPSNGTNVHHQGCASAPHNRTRQQYDSRSCAGVYTTSGKPCSSESTYPNPGAQPYTRSGRSLERVHVAPERAPNRSDSVRVGRKSGAQQPTRVQSVESIPVESFHKTSKFSAFAYTPKLLYLSINQSINQSLSIL